MSAAAKTFLLGWYAVTILFVIQSVGKPRNPITPRLAAHIIFTVFCLAGLVLIA